MYSGNWQLLGILGSVNLVRSPKVGYLLAEFGVNNGDATAIAPDGNTLGSYEGAVRWASPDMRTSIAYSFRVGDGNVKTNAQGTPVNNADFGALYTIYSPKRQLRQHHSLVVTRRYGMHWSTEAEGLYYRQAGDKSASTVWKWGGPGYGGSNAAGVNGRVIYDFNSKLAAGVRLETFHSADGFFLLPLNLYFVNGVPTVSKGYFSDFTFGVNYKPIKSMKIRPEIRYDWNNNGAFGTTSASVLNGTRKAFTDNLAWNMDILFYF
jgi:hypothetical protein